MVVWIELNLAVVGGSGCRSDLMSGVAWHRYRHRLFRRLSEAART
jgi:hypothetical protein